MLSIPATFSPSTDPSTYAETAVEMSRAQADYTKFIADVNHGTLPTLATAQPDVYGNSLDDNAGMPSDLQAVVLTYYQPAMPIIATPSSPYVYNKTTTVSISNTVKESITAKVGGAAKGFTASVEAAYGVTNVLTETGQLVIDQTFTNANGADRFYVPWLQCYRMAVCKNGAATPYGFHGGIKENVWWYENQWGNRLLTFNQSMTWDDYPSANISWAVYDIDGNRVVHVT